jgi:hypothetical protein
MERINSRLSERARNDYDFKERINGRLVKEQGMTKT